MVKVYKCGVGEGTVFKDKKGADGGGGGPCIAKMSGSPTPVDGQFAKQPFTVEIAKGVDIAAIIAIVDGYPDDGSNDDHDDDDGDD